MQLKNVHSFIYLGRGDTRHITAGPKHYRYVLCSRPGRMKPATGEEKICKKCLKIYNENEL